ncbi:hypothetical protein [Mucilaginibacter ginsenosidivorax]|uniref:hypothetical protein n=1 Tax=Mucilaginibacter ginsenosidivorax TaxID=862126 RepID=UPI0013154739|nr:hypothetical protein [Mucilaginibacter ginsenosidivorax]
MKNLVRKNICLSLLLIVVIMLSSFMLTKPADKPTFYVVGDSGLAEDACDASLQYFII